MTSLTIELTAHARLSKMYHKRRNSAGHYSFSTNIATIIMRCTCSFNGTYQLCWHNTKNKVEIPIRVQQDILKTVLETCRKFPVTFDVWIADNVRKQPCVTDQQVPEVDVAKINERDSTKNKASGLVRCNANIFIERKDFVIVYDT